MGQGMSGGQAVTVKHVSPREIPEEQNPITKDEQLWLAVFIRCDFETLDNLILVCKDFHNLLSWHRFWLEKCLYTGCNLPPIRWREFLLKNNKVIDYRPICFNNPYGRSLAYRISEEDTLQDLQKSYRYMKFSIHHNGNGMKLERGEEFLVQDERVKTCFATSYGVCSRYFEIDLVKAGIEPWILDEVRPIITVRELCCCRADCGAVYKLDVQLLLYGEHFSENAVSPRFKSLTREWEQWEGGQAWEVSELKFTEYSLGVRRVGILSSGMDRQFWAGHYGSKFANTEVIISFPEETKLLTIEDFPDPPVTNNPINGPLASRIRVPIGLRAQGRFRHIRPH